MYLKKMVASGFKSFADKIDMTFIPSINGVVGPNGSGKSNVVDAIRWVLGEQSVKSLRGDGTMTDVIFSGSKSRRAMNVASVSLLFDNSDRYLNLDVDEIVIKRRLYTDGTNEYYINNEKCRLKDIIDIFLDSGVGKESFNIISQGKVEEIIQDKPEERRFIFEEAAGVIKYKKRKQEALRKLERTHNNMNRVTDIMEEMKNQLEPLEEQSKKAKEYKIKKQELENLDIALITHDITKLNIEYQEKNEKIEKYNQDIVNLSTTSSTNDAKIEKYKQQLVLLEEEVNNSQKQYVEQISIVENLKSKKDMLLESKKYEVEEKKIHDQLVYNQEQILRYQKDIQTIEINKEEKEKQKQTLNNQKQELETEIIKIKDRRNQIEEQLAKTLRQNQTITSRISYLEEAINSNATLPNSVRSILNNPKLTGIHDAIGNVIEIDKQYTKAIKTTLGYASNYVIVDTTNHAKLAINYLKEQKLGKVTFFPIDVIKPKKIEANYYSILKESTGFINIASNLIKCDPLYRPIIENQLGNVVVAKDMDSAINISKKLLYRYRIVTLDGELLHVGGSITGGVETNRRSIVEDKYELETKIQELEKNKKLISELENSINEQDYIYQSLQDKEYLLNKDYLMVKQEIDAIYEQINFMTSKKQQLEEEIERMDILLNDKVSIEEQQIMEKYYAELTKLEKLKQYVELQKEKRSRLNIEYGELQDKNKKENSLLYQKSKELKELEIETNRIDVKLDTLLNRLTDTYNITYERAYVLYKLTENIDEARHKVNNLKRSIKELGDVNIGAIEEFDRINERYTFLKEQKEDLDKAEATLLEIMDEMDDVFTKEFTKYFEVINQNFKQTFKELFKGGDAYLKLTLPENILETGVEIIASPPGKQMKKLTLLSGGEKTLTAISLLFAILKSRPVPFCVLDEVEAALDEVNVKSFGEYVKKLKDKTQFILITHKQKTMEYADILYGITMQESGVSKLVSVKLEGIA